ncbi:MAG: RDD family protein [Gammaproteobacteria bacterium]|nr:RDD family protein [Gammaproteobacteria bacterium]
MLDTIKTAETPEGVELKLTCVSFYSRSVAWLIDTLIHGVIIILLLFILPRLGDFGMGLLFIVMFFLSWLYPVFFEIYFQGQTPGKKAMKIQVLQIDGTMVSWGASLIRNLLRTVDFLPFFYALGVMTMLMSKDFRRLGDLVANTIVVYKRDLKDKAFLDQEFVGIYTPEITLSGKEQQTIISYAERFEYFSPERAEELALLAVPLMDKLPSQSIHLTEKAPTEFENPASERLLGIANYLMGRR